VRSVLNKVTHIKECIDTTMRTVALQRQLQPTINGEVRKTARCKLIDTVEERLARGVCAVMISLQKLETL
jgi:hypothetical protein